MKDKKRKSMVSGPFDSIDCDRPEILQEIRLNLTRLLQ